MRRLTTRLGLLLILLLSLGAARAGAQRPRPVADVLAAADAAWKAGNHDEARAAYGEVVQRDSTIARALFRYGTLLGWRNDFDRAIAVLRQYCRLAPTDDDGRVALARTLAWSGRYDESIATYDSLLARDAGQRDAALGAAQTLAWSGRLDSAVTRYDRWLRGHAGDADGWIGLAQAWRWSGRPTAARQALQRALAAQPDHRDALAQLRSVEAALAPSLEPTISSTNDSDKNAATTFGIRAGIAAPWSALVLADASVRFAELGAKRGTAATLRAATTWTAPGGRWTVRGDLGATRLEGREAPATDARTSIVPVASIRASGRPGTRVSLGAAVGHVAFDENAALILARLATTSFDANADLTLQRRLTLAAEGSRTTIAGDSSPNTRVAGAGALRYAALRSVSVAGGIRYFGYDHAATDGYFSPKTYVLAEVSARMRSGGETGWGFEGEAGLGSQTITAFDATHTSRPAERVTAAIAYRPQPGVEWTLGGAFANVASPVTVSTANYRAWSVVLKSRLRL